LSQPFPESLPASGLGEVEALELFSREIAASSAHLGGESAMAHMDPPPPDIAIEITALNARYNQNLLHPDLSPLASRAEAHVVGWIAEAFGMGAGHMCGGSTLANLTALWAARESGVTRVVASRDAHLSVAKAAHILGLDYLAVEVDEFGRLAMDALPGLGESALVLTAGTTGRGAIDPLTDPRAGTARWLHVDAAWAGPLRLTRYGHLLDGVDTADSVAISAHKWFFQPKDSAICLFAEEEAQERVSFAGSYLARPNVGVQGSRGAVGLTLLATLMALGREGIDERIHRCMSLAGELARRLDDDVRAELKGVPTTGVVNWRPVQGGIDSLIRDLKGVSSTVEIDGDVWMRNVAANPHARTEAIWERLSGAL
jgi:glutamate/tyrosine decarboxylase-like PLP-dependent enzyme